MVGTDLTPYRSLSRPLAVVEPYRKVELVQLIPVVKDFKELIQDKVKEVQDVCTSLQNLNIPFSESIILKKVWRWNHTCHCFPKHKLLLIWGPKETNDGDTGAFVVKSECDSGIGYLLLGYRNSFTSGIQEYDGFSIYEIWIAVAEKVPILLKKIHDRMDKILKNSIFPGYIK